MAPMQRLSNRWSWIEDLVDGEGEITIGRMGSVRCAAIATDDDVLAMLARRPGESLEDLLTRLDDAVRLAMEEATYTDEINA